jgi:hypothetical protein
MVVQNYHRIWSFDFFSLSNASTTILAFYSDSDSNDPDLNSLFLEQNESALNIYRITTMTRRKRYVVLHDFTPKGSPPKKNNGAAKKIQIQHFEDSFTMRKFDLIGN